ncbi:MAG: beta-N-acetylglucosaminidase domain-containing protein [Bifidobacteriaceae bacterium]|jgi:hypothetical protein|nr:beta-N-acetylglucosaminidase domain-containing protein [Bifidobacteriaceae bacterium]
MSDFSVGLVEGFYGRPWSHRDRLATLRLFPEFGFDTYYYAPKNDPLQRDRWRQPYPARALGRLSELAREALALGARFSVAISPGLSLRPWDPTDLRLLEAKLKHLYEAGVRHFAILFDDLPPVLDQPEAVAAFGPGPAGLGRAHGAVGARVAAFLRERLRLDGPVELCPQDYAGLEPTPYRRALAETLPADARIMWTGADVVVGAVTEDDVRRAGAAFERELILWDNFPVNDFDRSRAFLGPLVGRPARVDGLPLAGIAANPMVEAAPSWLALASVGRWAADPARYDPAAAARAALEQIAGPFAARLEPLVRVCSSWPPSAPRDAELAALVARARAGRADAADLDRLGNRCQELAGLSSRLPASGSPVPDALAGQLRPWLAAGRRAGLTGLACVAALRAAEGPPARQERARSRLRAALAAWRAAPKDVLRPLLEPWAAELAGETPPETIAAPAVSPPRTG